MWICGLISKIFAYFRAGMLPILVGVAPMWAAMSWMETGKQAFAKTIGWLGRVPGLQAPSAALVMATGSAIMATGRARRRQPGHHADAHPERHHPPSRHDPRDRARSAILGSAGGGGGILPSILGMGVAVPAAACARPWAARAQGKAATAVGGEASTGRCQTRCRPEVWPDCFPDSAGATANHRERTAAASTPSRWKAIPRAANHRTPATSHRERTARGNGGKPQGANGNGAGSPVPPAPDGAPPDPSGGNRPQGTNDAGRVRPRGRTGRRGPFLHAQRQDILTH